MRFMADLTFGEPRGFRRPILRFGRPGPRVRFIGAMSKRFVLPILILASAGWPGCGEAQARDRDHDRLPDAWERRYGLSTTEPSARGDRDRDRLSNGREYRLRTNPRRRDTDR